MRSKRFFFVLRRTWIIHFWWICFHGLGGVEPGIARMVPKAPYLELLKSFKVHEKLAWKGFRHKCERRLRAVLGRLRQFLLVEESVADQRCQQVSRLHPETSWFSFFALSAIWAGWLLGHGSDLAAHQKLAGFMSFRNFPVAGQLWFLLHFVFGSLAPLLHFVFEPHLGTSFCLWTELF